MPAACGSRGPCRFRGRAGAGGRKEKAHGGLPVGFVVGGSRLAAAPTKTPGGALSSAPPGARTRRRSGRLLPPAPAVAEQAQGAQAEQGQRGGLGDGGGGGADLH